jgi:hypothetical protein
MSMYDNGMNHPNWDRAEREHLDPERDQSQEEEVREVYLCIEGVHGREAGTFDEAKKNFVEYLRAKADEIETLCVGDADEQGLFHLDCGLIVAMGDA